MMTNRLLPYLLTHLLFAIIFTSVEGDELCKDCHNGSDNRTPAVNRGMIDRSVHKGIACTDCHESILNQRHPGEVFETVECAGCHYDAFENYQYHGNNRVKSEAPTPFCKDCHGTHIILSSDNKHSMTHQSNLLQTCGACHERLVEDKKPPHWETYPSQNSKATTCRNCHFSNGSGHSILTLRK